jgi:hypothetical protein
MKTLRDILLTQYIGAITVGLLAAQAIMALVNAIVQAGAAYWAIHQYEGALGPSREFSWRNPITSLVSVSLEILICLALIRWLYSEPMTEADKDVVEQNDQQ